LKVIEKESDQRGLKISPSLVEKAPQSPGEAFTVGGKKGKKSRENERPCSNQLLEENRFFSAEGGEKGSIVAKQGEGRESMSKSEKTGSR